MEEERTEEQIIGDREQLFPTRGMKLVNGLFILSLFFYKSGFIFIAYLAWIGYLIYRIKKAGKEESRTPYYILIVLAAVMVCVNLFYLLRG